MKKILLTFLMLCTAINAWSYSEETVTISCDGTNSSPFTVEATTGSAGMEGEQYWEIRDGYNLKVKAQQGYYITKVEFAQTGDNVETWNKLQKYTGRSWVRPSDDNEYYDVITFSNKYNFTKVTSITVTYYHVCYGATHHDGLPATCKMQGRAEYWECACGKIYSNAGCTNEVTDMAALATEKDPTNHKVTLTKVDAVAATCVSEGSIEHWYCNDCGHRFYDAAGQNPIAGDNATTDIDPKNHNDKVKEVAYRNASVIEEGVYHHWHCEACGNDYADADCTKDMNGTTVKAKYDADALLVGSTTVDESYLLGEGATVTFNGDVLLLDINGDAHEYTLSDSEYLKIDFSHTFKLKANQDPDQEENYYSTFFTGEGAYRVPATAKAYTGTVEDGEDESIDILALHAVDDVIPCGEAVIVRGSQKDITLMPSCKALSPLATNILEGTDEATTLGAGQYALSLGQNGVGFYLWDGRTIGANKAYLTLTDSNIKALAFKFEEDSTTGIATPSNSPEEMTPSNSPEGGETVAYDVTGVRVGNNYKGVVIKNGKKVIR